MVAKVCGCQEAQPDMGPINHALSTIAHRVKPDNVHVLYGGRIIESGAELASLEKEGYERFET